MLPNEDQLMWCIYRDGQIVDGAGGLAIGGTEIAAWERAVDPFQKWAIDRAKSEGCKARRCAIMIINP